MDARRAANIIGIPFYVWDFSRALQARRHRRLRRRVRRRPHPEPVHALQREDQVRRPAREGARPRLRRGRAPATTPRSCTDAARQPRAAPRRATGPRTSPTCSACSPPSSSPTRCSRSARRPSKAEVRAEAAARGLQRREQARQPRHLLHPRRRHPRLARGARRRRTRARSSTATAPPSAPTRARTRSRSGSARDCRSASRAADGKPRFVLEVRPATNRSSSARARRSTSAELAGARFTWAGPAARGCERAVRLRGADPRARRSGARGRRSCADGELVITPDQPLNGVAPGQTAVVYVGTRVLGQCTIDRTVCAPVPADRSRPEASPAARSPDVGAAAYSSRQWRSTYDDLGDGAAPRRER